jgi:hypothetical protein
MIASRRGAWVPEDLIGHCHFDQFPTEVLRVARTE